MDERQVVSISASSADEAESRSEGLRTKGIESFLDDLIRHQCELIQAYAGMAMIRPTRDAPNGATGKFFADPKFRLSPDDMKRLGEIAARAAKENRSIMDSLSISKGLLSSQPDYRVLAAPLRLGGKAQGASVCLVPFASEMDLEDGLTRLELSGAALETYLWRQQAIAEAQSKIQMREALDLLDKSSQGHNAGEMASLFAHELQRRFGCQRVSIGLVKGHAIQLRAISGAEDLDRHSELAEALEALMEECADQDIEIRYPQPEDAAPSERRVVRAHHAVSERFGPVAIASFPLRVEDGLIGVVVMERDADDPFNDATLGLLRLIAEYIGPILWTRRMADRGIMAVTRDRSIEMAQVVVGPEKTGPKILAALVGIILLLTLVIPVSDRVVAEGRVIAEVRREISAPFASYIREVFVEPGDEVTAGQLLVQLETNELDLEYFSKQHEHLRLQRQADKARTERDTSQASMFDIQAGAVEAELELLRYKLDRSEIRAPISGTITQGRLDDILGESVDPSKPLLEIAQLDTMKVLVLVPEAGIARIRDEQRGSLAMTARPSEKIEFIVTSITPASDLFEQQNVYRVDAMLVDPPAWLRPGMEGQAKIYGDTTNLFTVYTRPMWDAIRMRWWW